MKKETKMYEMLTKPRELPGWVFLLAGLLSGVVGILCFLILFKEPPINSGEPFITRGPQLTVLSKADSVSAIIMSERNFRMVVGDQVIKGESQEVIPPYWEHETLVQAIIDTAPPGKWIVIENVTDLRIIVTGDGVQVMKPPHAEDMFLSLFLAIIAVSVTFIIIMVLAIVIQPWIKELHKRQKEKQESEQPAY